MNLRIRPSRILLALGLLILTMIFIAPLLWIASTSFKTNNDATSLPLSWQPHPVSTQAYRTVLSTSSQTPVLRWFFNSLLAGVINAVLVVAVDALAAKYEQYARRAPAGPFIRLVPTRLLCWRAS